MLKKICIAAIAIALTPTATYAFDIESDKKMHLNTSIILSSGIFFTHQGIAKRLEEKLSPSSSSFVAMSSCMALGAAKEIYDDIHRTGFDNKDMMANTAGCAIGTLASHIFSSTILITPEASIDGEVSGLKFTKIF